MTTFSKDDMRPCPKKAQAVKNTTQLEDKQSAKLQHLNPIRGGLVWSGVEAGGGWGGFRPPPLFYSLTTYANEIKFGTVIVHYIINNLVK